MSRSPTLGHKHGLPQSLIPSFSVAFLRPFPSPTRYHCLTGVPSALAAKAFLEAVVETIIIIEPSCLSKGWAIASIRCVLFEGQYT